MKLEIPLDLHKQNIEQKLTEQVLLVGGFRFYKSITTLDVLEIIL